MRQIKCACAEKETLSLLIVASGAGLLKNMLAGIDRCYVNLNNEDWDISGSMVFGYNTESTAPNWVTLAPMGLCIMEG